MTRLDWIILALVATLAWFGYRQGFIVGVLSFGGFAVGAFIGTRLGPQLLPEGAASPYAPAFGLLGALLAGAMLASGLEVLGFRLRRSLALPGLGLLDGLLGAMLAGAIGLGIAWMLAAVVAQLPGQVRLRADIQHSAILRELNELLPPSGPILDALARLDPLPTISGPPPDVAAPAPAIAAAPGVRVASRSVVRILGTACGLAIEGSGWVAAPGEVVTNAHVIAGEDDTVVQLGGTAPSLPARAIAFDAKDDVAVLRVPDLPAAPLTLLSAPRSGESGAILGFPLNGPYRVEPARIGQTQRTLSDNAYGEGPVSRLLTPLRGLVRPGNSGGPVVDAGGRVLTTIFASTTGAAPPSGFGVANQTVASVLAGAGDPVGTGPCAAG
jgi:S1-C subfamily serine protease